MRATDMIHQAVLDAGIPDAQVARVERRVFTFVLGSDRRSTAARAGERSTRGRRAQLAPSEIPAHDRLAEHLDQPVDWDAEFDADLQDLRILIETIRSTS